MSKMASATGTHVHHEAASRTVTESSFIRKLGRFLAHFGEMCLAMCIGLAVLDTVYVAAAGLAGSSDPFVQYPVLSAIVVAFNMTAPMAAWMRFRGMDWGLIAEMSAAMVVEAIVILVAYWLGIVPNASASGKTTLWWWQHGLMMPVMLVPMLLRLNHYTGSMNHQAHAM